MNLRKYIFITLVFCLPTLLLAQENQKSFSIYLVRHAEKAVSSETSKDPPLSDCGKARAQYLAKSLKKKRIEAVYSTDYKRTINTAKPTAKAKSLEIEFYNPRELKQFAELLLTKKQNALVVGHSNTTPQLVGFLLKDQLESIPEDIYNRVYQIIIKAGKVSLILSDSNFECKKITRNIKQNLKN